MTLKSFSTVFDRFAHAFEAVPRMRELVRTLAANGQLLPTTTQSVGWPTVAMKELCELITDGEHATPQRTSTGVPLATAKNVRDGFLDLGHTDYVSESTAEKCWKRCKPKHHDILMVCVGATTGRVCLVLDPPDIVLVRSVALIRPKTNLITPSYLDLFLRSSIGQTQIWANVKQSAQPCLYLGRMAEFEIALPPIDEQQRIVARVDELMALCDRLEAQQKERETRHAALARASLSRFADAPTPANLTFLFHKSYTIPPNDLRKSILTLAVQGKLVRQDAIDGSAEQLLDALSIRREFNGTDSEESLPFSIPPAWACARLGEIYDSSFYGPRFGREEYVKEGGIPTIRTTDMTAHGQIVLRNPPHVRIEDSGKLELYTGELTG